LRTSPRRIRSAYLIERASFVACHQFEFVDKIDMLEYAAPGAVFLLNATGDADAVWDRLPREMQEQMIEKRIRFFVIDAYALAKQVGMGGRINTIMQTCFFGISGILPRDEAIAHIKKSIEKTYGSAVPKWCDETAKWWTWRSLIFTRFRCRRKSPPRIRAHHSFRLSRRISCRKSVP
jgi:pyruvate-ferredoxin/flavodoxin oxidoreductase